MSSPPIPKVTLTQHSIIDRNPILENDEEKLTLDKGLRIGDRVNSEWGMAIITNTYPNGDIEAKWDYNNETNTIHKSKVWLKGEGKCRYSVGERIETKFGGATVTKVYHQGDLEAKWDYNGLIATIRSDKVWYPGEPPVVYKLNHLEIGKSNADEVNQELPRFHHQIHGHRYYHQIKEAEDVEYQTLVNMNAWEGPFDLPEGHKALGTTWVYNAKGDENGKLSKIKARLCLRGDQQKVDLQHRDAYSPVMNFTSLRALLAIHVGMEGVTYHQLDVEAAYLTSEVRRETYINMPPGRVIEGHEKQVYRLIKALYGGADSGRCFYDAFKKYHIDIGFQDIHQDKCYMQLYEEDEWVKVLYHVDDVAIVTNSPRLLEKYSKELGKKYKFKVSILKYFLNVKIDFTSRSTILSLKAQRDKMIRAFKLEGVKATKSPVLAGEQPNRAQLEDKSKLVMFAYREAVGHLQYLCGATHPEISYALKIASKFCAEHAAPHVQWLKHILKYMSGEYVPLTMEASHSPEEESLVIWTDSSHAGDPDTRRSLTSYIATYNGRLIDWKCQFQKIVSHSSTESELMALDAGVRSALALAWLIEGMGGIVKRPIPIRVDNQAAVSLSRNPIQPGRNAHMHARWFYVRDMVEEKKIIVEKVSTDDQLADLLCAHKSTAQFIKLRNLVMKYDNTCAGKEKPSLGTSNAPSASTKPTSRLGSIQEKEIAPSEPGRERSDVKGINQRREGRSSKAKEKTD